MVEQNKGLGDFENIPTEPDSSANGENSETEEDFQNFSKSLRTNFPNFDSFTLRWAQRKVENLRKKGKNIEEIDTLFSFHNEVWGKYNVMIERVPMQKRGALLQVFIDILYAEKHGKTHATKLKKVEAIGTAIDGFSKYQDLARFKIAEEVKIGAVMQKTLDILHDETPKQFKAVSENLGMAFFKGSKEIFTRSLRDLKIVDDPKKFFGRFKTIEDLKKFFITMKKAALADAKYLINMTSVFSRRKSKDILTKLDRLDEKNPIAIFNFILELEKQRNDKVIENLTKEKKEAKAKKKKENNKQEEDSEKSDNVIDFKAKRQEKEEGKNEETEDETEVVDESAEKAQKRIEFTKLIEHAEKTKEAAANLNLPNSDEYWKESKKRIELLKESSQWPHYQKLNAGDPNIPSNSKKMDGETLRPRWVNVKPNNLNIKRSEDTCSHLKTLEESGYELSAMMGFFSINWQNENSRLYTPDEYISKMRFELANLDRESGAKMKKAV